MIALLFLMYGLFGITFIFGSIAMQHVAPMFFIGMRMIVSSIVILGFLIVRQLYQRRCVLDSNETCTTHREPVAGVWSVVKVQRDHIVLFLVLCVVHIFVPYVGEFWALQYLTASKVSLIWSLSPFITALFAWIMFQEKMTLLKMVGLCIGILGFVPVIMHEGVGEYNLSSLYNVSTADLALVCAVISAAYAWSLFKKTMHKGYSTLVINGWAMLGGGILSLMVSPYFEPWHPFPVNNWAIMISCLLALVIIGGVICYNLYGYLLGTYTVTFLAFAGGLVPFFTAVFQWIILGQGVSNAFVIGLMTISLGLYIFYKEELRQGYIK
jgi:drug/metabolite transporter (DMT)-like permease